MDGTGGVRYRYSKYIARVRARFKGICGPVNIPWGSELEARDGFLLWGGGPLCSVTSQNAYDYFSQNDDERGQKRGALVSAILNCLRDSRSKDYQVKWDKVWGDGLCQQYRRPEHENYWIWNYEFYNAPIGDLEHIADLVVAKTAGRNH